MATRLKTQKDLIDNNKYVVNHPEFGQVSFTCPTPRQLDILKEYKKITKTNK